MINVIVGHQGQDGRLLSDLLERQGRQWIGIGRGAIDTNIDSLELCPVDITDANQVHGLIQAYQPACIYYLAASHQSSQQRAGCSPYDRYESGYRVNTLGPLNCLEAIYQYGLSTKFFYASSSLIYKPPSDSNTRLTESSPMQPDEEYAIEKVYAMRACCEYRALGVHATVGILFNHESIYRQRYFFSMKVIHAIKEIIGGRRHFLEIGSRDAVVDWLYAPDVVHAMVELLDQAKAEDYVIASGVPHTTGEFIDCAFKTVGLDARMYVKVNERQLNRKNTGRVGDPSKIKEAIHWRPTMSFESMVQHMTKCVVGDQREQSKRNYAESHHE
ncbi:GDP-mannose 4,6-dehydratase [Poriferisphaera sp. WC338]|uniref:GDP-mannose 4,6-dehydratase n=1 Tax=Poriferisphaera sp. WC338 TaxID=3425129 RepID=UPI003D814E9A